MVSAKCCCHERNRSSETGGAAPDHQDVARAGSALRWVTMATVLPATMVVELTRVRKAM
jgi:hypothetical protein